jgi:hypothetical protein
MATRTIQMPDGTIVKNVPDDAADFGQSLSPLMSGMLASREYIIDRLPDAMKQGIFRPLPSEIRQASAEANPAATTIGGMAAPVAAGLLAPGKIGYQALTAGLLEAAREGSDWQSIRTEAAYAGLGQGVGDFASRVASGIARGVKAAAGKQVLTTTSQPLRMVAETGLARGVIDDLNQKTLLSKLGKVFGIDDMTELGSAQLAQAADNIGLVYDDALDFAGVPDLSQAKALIDNIDPKVLPGKARLLKQLDMATDPDAFRAAHRELRDLVPKLRQSQLPLIADEAALAVDAMDSAGAAAGADMSLLKEANQRWKLFRTIEETPEAWIDGTLNARGLAVKMGRETSKGFGTSLKRGKQNITGTVQAFADDVMKLAADRPARGNSGTAERFITGAGVVGGGSALLSGSIDPATAGAALIGYGVIPPMAAAASVGEATPIVGKALAASRTLDDNKANE